MLMPRWVYLHIFIIFDFIAPTDLIIYAVFKVTYCLSTPDHYTFWVDHSNPSKPLPYECRCVHKSMAMLECVLPVSFIKRKCFWLFANRPAYDVRLINRSILFKCSFLAIVFIYDMHFKYPKPEQSRNAKPGLSIKCSNHLTHKNSLPI